MGNNQINQSDNIHDIYKNYQNHWYVGVEREVQKLGYHIDVRSDRFHKNNFLSLYQTVKPQYEQDTTMSTNESLFATELENIKRSRNSFYPSQEFQVTTLLQDCDPCFSDYEKRVINLLSTLSGSLLEIFQAFRRTKLPKTSHDLDIHTFKYITYTQLIKFRDSYVQVIIYQFRFQFIIIILSNMLRLISANFQILTHFSVLSLTCYSMMRSPLTFTRSKNKNNYSKIRRFISNQSNPNKKPSLISEFQVSFVQIAQPEITFKLKDLPRLIKILRLSSIRFHKVPTRLLQLRMLILGSYPQDPRLDCFQVPFFTNPPLKKQYKQTPHHKMKQLVICFQSIYSTIMDYYQQFAQKPSNLSTDELISVFNYVLCKSKLQNPYTHFDIMQKYIGNLDGVEGIYLTIMEATFYID